jgi:drug/metabolite transporter (DMT)-like permease
VVRAVRRFVERAPGSRPFLLGAAVVVLAGVALAVPRLDRIAPHMRESPAALIPILGAALGLACAAVCAIAVMVGVIRSRDSGHEDSAK